jgi:pSer/pThr/pTyr-binding forkhead associated (FHA) protein
MTSGRAVVAMEEFLTACGAAGPLELMVKNRGQTAMRWSAPQPFALIGSDPAADVSLDHPRVDGRHAYLQVIEGGVYWVDLGSQGGTRWEHGTARSGWLNPPHGIGIGPYVVQLAAEDREAVDSTRRRAVRPDPFASRPQDSDDLPHVVLEFRRDSAKPIRWRMRHILTMVGNSSLCKVRLAAPGVSPFHCSLLRTAAGVWVVNLGHEGVTVNGSRIRAARLDDGDELEIGEVLIRLFFKTPATTNGTNGSLAARAMGPADLLAHPTTPSRELATSRPKAVWMAPGREAGRLLAERVSGEGDLSASLLAAVLDQFGQMQQQFLDQFQQTTLMMFRALGTMHRDQMEELRERLDSLHQLGENLQAFQAHMASTVPPGSGSPVHEGANPTPPPAGPAGTATASRGDTGGVGQGNPSVAAMVREPQSPAEDGTEDLRAKVRSIVDHPNNTSLNVHEWLIGRIAALEDEQRTRWQKILDLVRGR